MSSPSEINKTRQVVGQAVRIASRDVRTPKVVRTGVVQKIGVRRR